jgi:hypothetical protein
MRMSVCMSVCMCVDLYVCMSSSYWTPLSSLMEQIKKLKITLSFASPEKDFFFYIHDVITWEKNYKRSSNYYLYVCM